MMRDALTLSALVDDIQETFQSRFDGESFWISAQICNVKKRESDRRCYLTLEEYQNRVKVAEVKAVFWAGYYSEIEKFEKLTKQTFKDGLDILCHVRVRFHKVYGLNLDVIGIDLAHTLGSLEIERQQTMDRLIKENPQTIQLYDGVYRTYNNRLPLPLIIQKVALITAHNSDGQRDFMQELIRNKHGYKFDVREHLITIQGDAAHLAILQQLESIKRGGESFDAVAIVRGGGSETDFKPFNDYELARYVAAFPIPVFTGIGHDRNQSIVDLMAREQKTPTKVASFFVDHNFEFENNFIELKSSFYDLVAAQIENAKRNLNDAKRLVKLASPQVILNRGFAMIMQGDKVISDPAEIGENSEVQILMKQEKIFATVTKKIKNG